jgi:hypothetical protein
LEFDQQQCLLSYVKLHYDSLGLQATIPKRAGGFNIRQTDVYVQHVFKNSKERLGYIRSGLLGKQAWIYILLACSKAQAWLVLFGS